MLNGFFNMDGPFYKYGTLVFDLMILNFMWAIFGGPLIFIILIATGLFALPIFSSVPILIFIVLLIILLNIGAATTAMFYVTNRRVRDKDGYLTKDFFKSFKQNYKQATLVSAILMLFYYILYINISNIALLGSMAKFILPVQLFFCIELIFITIYIFPLLARFDMKTKDLFKTAFFISNKHLFTTLLCGAIFVGLIFLIVKVHAIFLFFLFSGYAMISSYFFEKVFKKYIPEEEYERENADVSQELPPLSDENFKIDDVDISLDENFSREDIEKLEKKNKDIKKEDE